MHVINTIETLKNDASKANLFFDDGTKFKLLLDTVANFGLYEGKEISGEEYEEILNFDIRKDLRLKALSFVTRALKTERQVRDYLFKRCQDYKVQDEIIDEVVEEFKDFGYINDKEFAEAFLRSRIKNKPRSKFMLKSEMLSKGISKELGEEVLEELDVDEFELLKTLYEKKFKNEKITFEDQKKISFLSRKGFSWDDILKLIRFFEKHDT